MPRTGNLLSVFLTAIVVMVGIAVGRKLTNRAGI